MKVKVLKRFKDKHTNKIHKVNDVLEVSKDRFEEILTKGELVEEIVEEPAETPEEPAETPEEPAETPEEPAETPEEPAETPEEPAETPEEPAETPEEVNDKKKSTKKTTK